MSNTQWVKKEEMEAKSIELLAASYANLDRFLPEISQRVVSYVLNGEPTTVLTELQDLGRGGDMQIVCAHLKDIGKRREFLKSLKSVNPDYCLRLGQVYHAISKGSKLPHCFTDAKLEPLESLLLAVQDAYMNWNQRGPDCGENPFNLELLEAMIENEGYSLEVLVKAAFQLEEPGFCGGTLDPFFAHLQGLDQAALRHREVLISSLSQADHRQRLYTLQRMRKCHVPLRPFLEKMVELALDSSKRVRETAETMLAEMKADACPLLEKMLIAGQNEQRVIAAKLLWAWDENSARSVLEARLSKEKSKNVSQAIHALLDRPNMKNPQLTVTELALPFLTPIPDHNPLGAETENAWHDCFEKVNGGINQLKAKQTRQYFGKLKPVGWDLVERAFRVLQQVNTEDKQLLKHLVYAGWYKEVADPFGVFWSRPELQSIHLVRFLVQVGALRAGNGHDRKTKSYGSWMEKLFPIFHRAHPQVGLRELAFAFQAAGLDPDSIGEALLASFQTETLPLELPPAKVWPYWAEHLNLLEKAFEAPGQGILDQYDKRRERANALVAIGSFPQPPDRLLTLLWTMALGPKNERPAAQRCLQNMPDKVERLIASLKGGTADSRTAAAEWLGRIGHTAAISSLLEALKREKNEAAKGEMMSALVLLGTPVDQFMDRSGLFLEAEKNLNKGIPEKIKWLPFDQLPIVHWADSGNVVEPQIVHWWLVQGFKLKNPEPGPLLRRYCAMLKESEREALGMFVLRAWIAEDTAPISRADAEKEAMNQATFIAQWSQKTANAKTVEQYYAEFLPTLLKHPKGSAIDSKGVLAIAGACVGRESTPLVTRYLKEWYGNRVAQCRALLQMIAWVEHPSATQLLLAVGTRFRTKSIQEEASKQALVLAERKGWTVVELADRTIPSAGLDENGVLALDFGPRRFTAKLNAELELVLFDGDGKVLKSLPEPRKDDDEAKAAEAKKILSAAKKELKSVLSMQGDRLYEAMCTQRSWSFSDWSLYLNGHPIVRHHCQRLVWAVVQGEKVVQLFRPLADGSLTDVKDEPITVEAEDLIRVAHECHVTPEQSHSWRQHLKDYEVEPLIEQFGRSVFSLGEERKQETEFNEFQGHMVEAFKLRGRANKLGYDRGQTQDGGWFYDYHKRFPTLGIEAILEFTGNSLPEGNRTVALTLLRFERIATEGKSVIGRAKMALSEVPSVLLSECWNDARQIAEEGTGFDPAWETKVQV